MNRAYYIQKILNSFIVRYVKTSNNVASIFLEFPVQTTLFYDLTLQLFRSSNTLNKVNTVVLTKIVNATHYSISFPQILTDIMTYGDKLDSWTWDSS